MLYLGYFILAFAGLQFLVALINYLFRPGLKTEYSKEEELVSILIPARNEENNIAQLLNDLLRQNYKNYEILVYDDLSSDNTPQIVGQYSQIDKRIQLISGRELPAGWLGKNHACHVLSSLSKGSYLLFLDADVRVDTFLLSKLVYFTRNKALKLVSVFPVQEMRSKGEWMSVPLMNYILLSLLALPLVRLSRFSSISAANGQCMFFEAQTYQRLKPHEIVKNNKVEDIQIARLYKKRRLKIACLASVREISCRMYRDLDEAIQGFSKNVLAFFGNSFILACLFWFINSFGWVALLPLGFYWVLAWFLLQLFIQLLVALTSHQKLGSYFLFALHRQFMLIRIIIRAETNRIRKETIWKGRIIS
ncbi:MAG: glycosyltransferase family 2 protein [Bacteroidales bacterium]|nr:glycosyltransferase family 2 protein [Bacteroidales bacterium]MDD4431309.1 glycosyltransferase family 2 protein [Bacteroidales bacterium]